ncbi:putative enzyme related to lactoylglutathione lyase [Rhodococcus sp. LBL1]|nr:putative enzyme related to lactoylglutathione lyase [Rhodococcus sp. LBL1]MDH6682742.1 putative enzyme related to lactoylglutathione lyase [Rhodococcus sp. LBL2]
MSRHSSYSEGTPSWVDLQTPDQAAAKTFYTTLFGWSYDDLPMMEGAIYSVATVRGERVAALAPMPAGSSTADDVSRWNTFLAVDDVDATAAKVAPAGGDLLLPAFDVGEYGRMALVADPTGAEVGLWQARNHIGATLVNETGTLIWNELVTDRPESALAFYRAVVGLGSAAMPIPGVGDYTVLQVDGDGVGGCVPPPRPDVPNHWHVYFCVEDADATVAQAVEAGGTVLADPFDMPTVGRMAVLSDPQGAVFSVMQPESAS